MPQEPTPTRIDITPTWETIAFYIATLAVDGTTFESRQIGREKLQKMARCADAYVASQKANPTTPTQVAGVRQDRKTGQYIPTINGVDTSPTSFDESEAMRIAQSQIKINKPSEA